MKLLSRNFILYTCIVLCIARTFSLHNSKCTNCGNGEEETNRRNEFDSEINGGGHNAKAQAMQGQLNVIKGRSHDHHEPDDDSQGSVATGAVLAISAWLIITVFGFIGLFLIPLKKYKSVYNFVLQFLTAMGFSTLIGDVVFHLIPHSLFSGHSHSHDHHDHNHSHDENHAHDDLDYGKLSILLFGVVFLYLVEIALKIIPLTRKRECGCHPGDDNTKLDYNKDGQQDNCHDEHKHHDCANTETARDIEITSRKHRLGGGVPSDVTATLTKKKIGMCLAPDHDDDSHTEIILQLPEADCSVAKEAKNVVLVLLFADMCHHVLDGLAIGALFIKGTRSAITNGISISLAIFFHELPHKVGDIALLVKSGFTERKATFIVVGTSSISVIGLIVGCFTAGKFESASKWIQLFTAGMFIYISLVLMMSQMLNAISKPELHLSAIILAQFLGMSIGFGIMLLLTKMEHSH